MASRKNVVFVGMMQNGKSSLVQQILRYSGEHEKAQGISIGQGNFAETQSCSSYPLEVPLKHHSLRQVTGSEDERREETVVPGRDFDFDDADDLDLKEVVEDSGKRLQLTIIDTPGLSDSANDQSSTSGMRVIDERHKLRILLALQEVENVHAICLVVRRDTSYGGDFRDLIKNLHDLFMFSVRSTAWNLNYHIIHTNIDVDDRASDLCEIRQRDFDKFGPPGAIHHFINNLPDLDSLLEVFLMNQALSKIFLSLSTQSPVKFSDLHYPKSAEHKKNDQTLMDSIRLAINKLKENIKTHEQEIVMGENEIERDRPGAELIKKRVDEYDKELEAIDCDTFSDIDGASEEAWTDRNAFGGGGRVFSFSTTTHISDIKKWHDGDGTWVEESRGGFDYSVKLQPNWGVTAKGSVTLRAKKKDKHVKSIASLRKKREPVAKQWQDFLHKSKEMRLQRSGLKAEIKKMEENMTDLRKDLAIVEQSGHSLSLATGADFVKYFTLDTPFAAALGYQLQGKVPWTIPPLDEIPRDEFEEVLDESFSESRLHLNSLKSKHQRLTALFGQANGIASITDRLVQPPLGTAEVRSAAALLENLTQATVNSGVKREGPELEGLTQLIEQLEQLGNSRRSGRHKDDDEAVMDMARPAAERTLAFAEKVSDDITDTLTSLEEAFEVEAAVQVAKDCLGSDEGVPVGVFSFLIEATGKDIDERFTSFFEELRVVIDLGEINLD